MVSLLCSTPYCSSIGNYLVQLFNDFGVDIIMLFIAFAEVTVVAYGYGIKRLVSKFDFASKLLYID